ncbi:MAG: BamA/TamA family outer membrane protein, partial [Rhodothermales bacterium]|nr:BamA/TamA family outer membrane protein [Rhodothermales bacterium]
ERIQYEIGVEGRLGEPYGEENFDVKLGAAYRHLTTTDDLWKSGWAENTLAAFFFNYDAFDYYHTQGWTAYAAARLGPHVLLSAGFRSDDYESIRNETGWSLFGGDNFRFNPPVDEGRMQSVVVTVEGGSVSRFHSRPSGAVFRIEAELGDGLGGDFSFNRIVADGRAYVRTSRRTTLAMRLRGGRAGGTVPIQKAFTLGGLGSVRGYPQNAFLGERMLLANVEYSIVDLKPFGAVLKDLQLTAFFDTGWVSRPDESFTVDDVFSSAGVGLGFFDRRLRLDLACPLTDRGGTRDPSLWLRLLPAF